MSKPPATVRHYWDACLFIDLINATPGNHEIVESLFDELVVAEPSVVAVTSALTIAEVAFAEAERKILDPLTLARIDAFWGPESPFEIIELYPRVSYEARSMIREALAFGQGLAAGDAIHLATARARGAVVFWTYDKKLLNMDGRFGFSVKKPASQTLPFSRAQPASPV